LPRGILGVFLGVTKGVRFCCFGNKHGNTNLKALLFLKIVYCACFLFCKHFHLRALKQDLNNTGKRCFIQSNILKLFMVLLAAFLEGGFFCWVIL
jgi:hypothetical protein